MKKVVEKKCKTIREVYSAIEESSELENAVVLIHEDVLMDVNERMITKATPCKKWSALALVGKNGKSITFKEVEDPELLVFISFE